METSSKSNESCHPWHKRVVRRGENLAVKFMWSSRCGEFGVSARARERERGCFRAARCKNKKPRCRELLPNVIAALGIDISLSGKEMAVIIEGD